MNFKRAQISLSHAIIFLGDVFECWTKARSLIVLLLFSKYITMDSQSYELQTWWNQYSFSLAMKCLVWKFKPNPDTRIKRFARLAIWNHWLVIIICNLLCSQSIDNYLNVSTEHSLHKELGLPWALGGVKCGSGVIGFASAYQINEINNSIQR